MKNITLVLFSIICVACSVTKQAAQSENTTTEIRTETVFVTDTVFVEYPQIVEKNQTLDTVSVLDNKYSKSEAIVSAGVLTHTMETKPVKTPVPVQTKTVYRDSIVFQDVVTYEILEVPAELTKWQSLRIKAGSLFLALIALTLIYLCAKYITKLSIH